MAITTYSELQTAVKNWLHRSNMDTIIPDLITLGEKRIFREVKHRSMEYPFSDVVYSTERQNLLLRSEELDSSSWSNNFSSMTADNVEAPDGTISAEKLVEDSSAGVAHEVYQGLTLPADTYTCSVYVKAGERHWVSLLSQPGVSSVFNYFDLDNGVKGTIGANTTGTIESVGSGWYRISVTFTSTSETTIYLQVNLADSDLGRLYDGDGSSGLYVWGAQIEAASSLTSYIPTEATSVYREAGTIGLPKGYIDLKYAYVNTSPGQHLKRQTSRFIFEKYPYRAAAGEPKYIGREGDHFIFGPYADSNYTIKGYYYRDIGPVADSAHNLFVNNPDLYLFAALAEAAPFMKDDKRIPIWEGKYEQAKEAIRGEYERERISGGGLNIRPA